MRFFRYPLVLASGPCACETIESFQSTRSGVEWIVKVSYSLSSIVKYVTRSGEACQPFGATSSYRNCAVRSSV